MRDEASHEDKVAWSLGGQCQHERASLVDDATTHFDQSDVAEDFRSFAALESDAECCSRAINVYRSSRSSITKSASALGSKVPWPFLPLHEDRSSFEQAVLPAVIQWRWPSTRRGL